MLTVRHIVSWKHWIDSHAVQITGYSRDGRAGNTAILSWLLVKPIFRPHRYILSLRNFIGCFTLHFRFNSAVQCSFAWKRYGHQQKHIVSSGGWSISDFSRSAAYWLLGRQLNDTYSYFTTIDYRSETNVYSSTICHLGHPIWGLWEVGFHGFLITMIITLFSIGLIVRVLMVKRTLQHAHLSHVCCLQSRFAIRSWCGIAIVFRFHHVLVAISFTLSFIEFLIPFETKSHANLSPLCEEPSTNWPDVDRALLTLAGENSPSPSSIS